MSLLARLIGLDGQELGRRTSYLLGGIIAAGLFVAGSIAFLGVALHAALRDYFPPIQAALLVALLAACAALATLLITAWSARRTSRALSRALKASTLATVAPAALSLASRHAGLLSAVLLAALAVWASRRPVKSPPR